MVYNKKQGAKSIVAILQQTWQTVDPGESWEVEKRQQLYYEEINGMFKF